MQNDIDSDCSKYMIEDRSMFFSFSLKKRDFVFYSDNNKEELLISILLVGVEISHDN